MEHLAPMPVQLNVIAIACDWRRAAGGSWAAAGRALKLRAGHSMAALCARVRAIVL